jgi:hypothetical protein
MFAPGAFFPLGVGIVGPLASLAAWGPGRKGFFWPLMCLAWLLADILWRVLAHCVYPIASLLASH